MPNVESSGFAAFLSLFAAVAILELLHDFLCIGRVGSYAVEDIISHSNSCCQRTFFAVVCFVGEILCNHNPFAANAHPPSEEGGFFQGVSGDILHMFCFVDGKRLRALSLKTRVF